MTVLSQVISCSRGERCAFGAEIRLDAELATTPRRGDVQGTALGGA